MRTRIVIICVFVLAVCVWLLLHHIVEQHKPVAREDAVILTNQQLSNQPDVPTTSRKLPSTNTPNALTSLPYPTAEAESNATMQRLLAVWQNPINFYGKVVDENTNPVEGASVNFSWNETLDKSGERTFSTTSDSNELFSLKDKLGPSVAVSVSRDGYYPRSGGAKYGSFGNPGFSPDPQNPIVFQLRKKGQGVELLTSDKGIQLRLALLIPTNGTPIRVDFFQKQISASGQLEISQNKPPWRTATNWSFKISVPDGGLVENNDEFQFEAPQTGYQPTIELHFSKSETNWITSLAKNYYIAFGSPRKYGWIHVESNLSQQTIFLKYAINVDGLRNLEPK